MSQQTPRPLGETTFATSWRIISASPKLRGANTLDVTKKGRRLDPAERSWQLNPVPELSIITTCMGRLHQLKQTLPINAAQPNVQCVVVDYSCPDHCGDWVEQHYPQVHVVRALGQTRFNVSRARNLGAAEATGDWLFFLDADHAMSIDFMSHMRAALTPDRFFHPAPMKNAYGLVLCGRTAFQSIGGYDEIITDWGGEDVDLHRRLALAGLRSADFSRDLLQPIEHGDEERTQFYEESNRDLSNAWNLLYSRIKCDVFRLTGHWPAPDLLPQLHEAAKHYCSIAFETGKPTRLEIGVHGPNAGRAMKVKQTLLYDLMPNPVPPR